MMIGPPLEIWFFATSLAIWVMYGFHAAVQSDAFVRRVPRLLDAQPGIPPPLVSPLTYGPGLEICIVSSEENENEGKPGVPCNEP